jgi:hypothetical protein
MQINVLHNVLNEHYLVENYEYVVILDRLLMMEQEDRDDYQLLNDQQYDNHLQKKRKTFLSIENKLIYQWMNESPEYDH